MTTPSRLAALLLLPLLAACPPPPSGADGGVDAGHLPAPELTSISPTQGPRTGGTTVTLNGANFEVGSRVLFGAGEASGVVLVNGRKLTARTPTGAPGAVNVTVINPDGQSALLPNWFVFEGDPAKTIEEAKVLGPLNTLDESGANPHLVTVTAEVSVPGITNAQGQGAGVKAQVGWTAALAGTPQGSNFTWVEAAFISDGDGPTPGDLSLDRYGAQLSLAGASGASPQVYYLAARFSLDGGTTWTFADADGSSNGISAAQLPKLSLMLPKVEWCRLGGQTAAAPAQVALKAGQSGPVIYGQVFAPGITNQSGAGADISGQLGYGAPGSDPEGWTWVNAAYNVDTGSGANDEFQASLPNPGLGTFAFAFRFSLKGGPYRTCDADGSTNGFAADQAGSLSVSAVGIDRCLLQHPAQLQVQVGLTSPVVYGRVWSQSVTDAAGQGAGIAAELGYGPQGIAHTDPAWTWKSANYSLDADGDAADEYTATLTGPSAGSYDYAFRFSYAGSWTYCDLDGSENGFAQPGQLQSSALVCKLQHVDGTSVASGQKVTAYGRVHVAGVTAGAGQGAGVRGQVGVGSPGQDASTGTGWGWQEAAYLGDIGASGEDEYKVEFHPAYTGSRAVAFRFSIDNGAAWTYCDLNGSDVGGYQVSEQHALNVTAHADIGWCSLWSPATLTVATSGTAPVLGRIYKSGVTPGSGASINAWLGFGNKSEDPGLAWTWIPASFKAVYGNDNEYEASFAGAPAGTTSYAYRFLDTASSVPMYCYGDLNGSGANGGGMGFNGEDGANDNLGAATVSP